jgi:hypothetical protein
MGWSRRGEPGAEDASDAAESTAKLAPEDTPTRLLAVEASLPLRSLAPAATAAKLSESESSLSELDMLFFFF